MRTEALIALLAACDFSTSVPSTDAPVIVDAAVDTPTVCATAGLQCAQPAVMIACGEACWVGCRERTVHAVAKQRCADWGGELTRFDNPVEQQCVNAAFAGSGRWLGLEQATTTVLKDGWSWGGTVSVTYDGWSAGQPNDLDGFETGDEQCAYLSNPTGFWQDTPCTSMLDAFVCRR